MGLYASQKQNLEQDLPRGKPQNERFAAFLDIQR
jgi:hypothetical protein